MFFHSFQIEELKSKERVIGQLERDLGSQGGHFAKLQMEKECIEERLQMSREAESWERRSSKAQLNDTSSPVSNAFLTYYMYYRKFTEI